MGIIAKHAILHFSIHVAKSNRHRSLECHKFQPVSTSSHRIPHYGEKHATNCQIFRQEKSSTPVNPGPTSGKSAFDSFIAAQTAASASGA